LAHHMLRNILQGKKELMALDHELRTVSNQSSALGDRISPDNNNVISKNNNIYDISKCETVNGGSGDVSDSSELGANNNKVNQKNSATNTQTNNSDNINQSTRPISLDSNNSNCDDMLASELAHTERLLNGVSGSGNGAGSTGGRCSSVNPKQEKSDVIDELVASLPDEVDETMPSPASGSNGVIITKQELDMDDCLEDKDRDDRTPSPAPSKNDSESLTLKRARVENIVSSMRASPALLGSQQGQVNGCKKRKLYHPQQHDNSAAERYAAAAAAGLNLGLTLQNFMLGASADPDDDDDDMEVTPHIHQKRVEKDVLKSQLRSMQEQLAEMQQKYVQLCSRMEQQSDTQEVDDSASDIMEDDSNNPDLSPDKSLIQSSPASTPIKDMGKNADASSMLQMMSKMMSAKIHSQLPTHPHMPGGFNGTHLFLQHMQQQAGLPHDGMSQHSQMSNAAMYQKLLMEQEARMVKESNHISPPQMPPMPHLPQIPKGSAIPSDLTNRLNMMRSSVSSVGPMSGSDLEGLADVLKTEITASLSNLVDSIVTRFVHQRRFLGKQSEAAAAAAEQLNKDLMMASQLLDRSKSPRTKVSSDRGPPSGNSSSSQSAMFQTPKPPQNLNSVAAAALYNSMSALGNSQVNPFCMPEPRENPEQAEALSLVVTPKKKRHKVTDTRITPRTVSRILAQDGIIPSASTPTESPSPRGSFHPPPPSMLPVSLPTSVAIPNPSLHESQVFSPYSPFFNPHGPPHGGPHGPQPSQFHHMKVSSSPPGMNGMMDPRDSPPLPHPPTMLHPALLAAAHHGNSPDYGHIRASMDVNDRNSDCNSADISYNGMEPTSSTLTPMHLRKAKLMFFWVRYPSSAVLKMYFPDIKFNKNNTAQLVKWFSNFREFYYIQMEKYARQSASEGMKNVDDIHVSNDSEIYRVLNLHYNRNNHIEVPQNFRYVVEQTLREFFRAIQGGKDTEQSWKKSIYKIISRLDDPVPEYFKSPNFLEQLE
ncbi:AAEL002769-PA, partial [Aedes aegypti]